MADGPVPTSSIQQQKSKKEDAVKSSDDPSSYNSNVVLADGVDVVGGHLEDEDNDLCSTENQIVIRDALRLQRDLLQENIAVPVKLKMVEKSIQDFRGFCAATQGMQETEGSSTDKNGEDAAEQQSILSLLESVSTSAALYAKQLKESTQRNPLGSHSSNDEADKNDTNRQKKRSARKQKRREKLDKLLERISQTPIELMFGVRIRRKYADEVARRYGLEPQPYYADLSDSDDTMSSFSSLVSSSDEATHATSRDGINTSRINGRIVKKTETTTSNKSGQKAPVQKAKTPPLPAPSPSPPLKKVDPKKRKKQSSTSEATQKPKGKKTGGESSEALDMLNWMDRLRMEMEQSERSTHKSNGGGKPKTQSSSSHDDLSIPPEAMEILKEALVAAAQDNSDEKLNEEVARTLATNFIQATAASAAASRMNPSTGGDSQAYPSSSSSAEIPGLSQDAAVEVWKEIQQYLRNLCLSNPTAQELAARTAAEHHTTKQKDLLPPAKTPPPPISALTKLAITENDKKSKKRKTKSTQASPYSESVHERRQQLLRLQAEKQQEHAMVVAQLREQEAKLRDAVAAAASAQRSWINYRPVDRPPFFIGQGPYGAVYQHEDFQITAHNEWLDEKMVVRGLRTYILIRALERHRLHDHCQARRREARFCLFLHCDKYRNGYLSYMCSGNEKLNIKSGREAPDLKDTQLDELDAGDIAFYETQCSHKPQLRAMEWDRLKQYHRRFYSMDSKLPQLAGDFWFMLNQLHLAYESAIQYNRQRKRFTPLTKRIPAQCYKEAPRQLPFDVQKHSVELVVPKNYLLNKSPIEQRRLLRNLAQVSQRCLVVSRATFVDEERQTSVETTPKTSNVDPPKIEAAVLQSKNQTAKKRKKKK